MSSERVRSIKPSGVREIFEMAGSGAINLGLGELDVEPPVEVLEALKRAVDQDRNRYGPTKGIDALRRRIAERERAENDSITEANVVITASGTQGAMAAFQALFDPGDEVLVPEPGFVLYEPESVLAGARPVPYLLPQEKGFQPDIDGMLESLTPKTKGIVVNSPSNPTGSVLSEESFKALRDIARDHDLWIISDEVYEDFIYDGGRHRGFLSELDRAVVLNSFSKSLAVPGWRVGFLTAPASVVDDIAKMQYHMVACAPTPPQFAIAEAFDVVKSFARSVLPMFDRRRRLMASRLNSIDGFECHMPEGAFYAFPSYSQNVRSGDLARTLVKAGVICAPGTAFGSSAEGHLRFSYAASEESISRGLDIVEEAVRKL